ncbi:MAG: STAS domain-containing protein [Phycisphaerae bacterium]
MMNRAVTNPPRQELRGDELRRSIAEVGGSGMEQPSTHLRIKRAESVSVVEFADRKILEEVSIQEIGEELAQLVEAHPGIRLLLNFRNVDHLSSAALGMLITLNKKVREQNGALKLSDINRQIFEVFKITRLNKVFDIHDSADEAISRFDA